MLPCDNAEDGDGHRQESHLGQGHRARVCDRWARFASAAPLQVQVHHCVPCAHKDNIL